MHQKRNIAIAFLTFLTLVGWVGAEAWQIYNTSTIPADTERALRPLDPEIKENVFVTLEERVANSK